MSRPVHAALCALALVAGFVVSSVASGVIHDLTTPDLPPCATEDSTGCYWDASQSGNGLGVDIVAP